MKLKISFFILLVFLVSNSLTNEELCKFDLNEVGGTNVDLLPHGVKFESTETKISRVKKHLDTLKNDLDKYIYLMNLAERETDLFYQFVLTNTDYALPLIYTPTVGEACVEFSRLYGSIPNFGVYLSYEDGYKKSSVLEILSSLQIEPPQIIVVTDGSRILGLGDLGANGMGISVGKLALYISAAGFHPNRTLPITLDVGTENENLINNNFYIGKKMKRLRDERFWEFLDEFLEAVKILWPEKRILSFNDDIQGTGAVITAGWINAIKMSDISILEHRILFYGAGSAAVGVADQMKAYIRTIVKDAGEDELKKMFYMIDSKGLLSGDRDRSTLAEHKLEYVRDDIIIAKGSSKNLYDIVELVQPTVLIGLSMQPKSFTPKIIRKLLDYSEKPIIMALSNPTSKSECSSIDAYEHTDGRCIFLSGSKFPNWKNPATGVLRTPGQGNNLYIFPGLGLGCYLSQPKEITDEMILEAAKALSEMTSEEQMENGNMYPGLDKIREISKGIAKSVAEFVVENGFSKVYEKDEDVDFKTIIDEFVYL